jgi:polysaccharide pyruvyl transferase WcaK-like protein
LNVASHFAAIGADVMDGFYWPPTVLRALDMCEQARALGLHVTILGFSFNARPSSYCIRAFRMLNPAIRLLSRDPVSLERFERLTGRRAVLVADTAFCLRPRMTRVVESVGQWARGQSAEGRTVVGFNMHALLLDEEGACSERTLVQVAARAISRLVDDMSVSAILIPHDFRGPRNDQALLAKCADLIPARSRDFVLLPDCEFMADELKALTGSCDLVMTGRMHLAIAALGMGVPIAVVSYQDKFEGLLEHFGLDRSALISPRQLGDFESVWNWMEAALHSRIELAAQVRAKLPGVLDLARRNFLWTSAEERSSPTGGGVRR